MQSLRSAQFGIVGHGRIYQTLLGAAQPPGISEGTENHAYQFLAIGEPGEILSDRSGLNLLLAVTDSWEPQLWRNVNLSCLEAGIPWLGIHTEAGQAMLGPLVVPGRSGCSTCLSLRQANAQEYIDDFLQRRACLASRSHRLSFAECWLTTAATSLLIELIQEDLRCFLSDPEQARCYNAFLYLQLGTLALQRHSFLPEPDCPDCQAFTDSPLQDTARPTSLILQSQPKLKPDTYRVRSLKDEKRQLTEHYVDAQSGLIRALNKDTGNLCANFVVKLTVQDGQRTEVGVGRSFDFEQSYVSALAEALERYGGLCPGEKRTAIRSCFRELGEQALNPRLLGFPSQEQYHRPDSSYVEYTDDLIFNWVWGYSFQAQRPILIPEQCVYYGSNPSSSKERRFLYEISNGCALGGCLEEAILYGMLEIAERDAFLLTWYTQLQVPRIDPYSAHDPLIGLILERIYHTTGYTVYAFNITLEQGVPCFWAMAVDEQRRPGMPRAVCSAGSHLDPQKALINALQEVSAVLQQQLERYPGERQRALPMLEDPYLVTRMSDHSLLYSLPEAFERLEFLYHTPHQQTFEEAFPEHFNAQPGTDLLEDLKDLLARYAQTGIDTLVVDQTKAEHRLSNFRCVKVLMPGTVPMTFGHHTRRLVGLHRLSTLPYTLGYRSRILEDADMNPYPHPFP